MVDFVQLVWPARGPVRMYAEVSVASIESVSEGPLDDYQRLALKRLGPWRMGRKAPHGWRFIRLDEEMPDWLVDLLGSVDPGVASVLH